MMKNLETREDMNKNIGNTRTFEREIKVWKSSKPKHHQKKSFRKIKRLDSHRKKNLAELEFMKLKMKNISVEDFE